ncbi:MAG TPA: type II toxin-antitoxin system VapC family toxin, partial [Candidatus Saccharimonadales bacterium]|nr:type II toxin-antitoxin system VapC family toxin [Candidatus Saccharimonadales bacterium]
MENRNVLIDSHVLIWLLYEPANLHPDAIGLLEDADAVFVSLVSFWELALMHQEGKLAYNSDDLMKGAEASSLQFLTLSPTHIRELSKIKLEHAAPIDALLLAQAKVEKCVFITADKYILASNYRTQNAA